MRVLRQFEDAEDTQDASEQERAAAFLTARSNTGRQQVHCLQCIHMVTSVHLIKSKINVSFSITR